MSIAEINAILGGLEYTPISEDPERDEGGMATILDVSGRDYYALTAYTIPKHFFDPEASGYIYAILNDYDEGRMPDIGVYLSEDVNFGEGIVKAGWHIETPGQIYIYDEDHPTILAVNQWDKVKSLFSSTPF